MGRSAVGTAGGVAVLQGGALLSPILRVGRADVSRGQALRKGQGLTLPEGSVYGGGRGPSSGWAPRKSSRKNPRSLHRRCDLRDGA